MENVRNGEIRVNKIYARIIVILLLLCAALGFAIGFFSAKDSFEGCKEVEQQTYSQPNISKEDLQGYGIQEVENVKKDSYIEETKAALGNSENMNVMLKIMNGMWGAIWAMVIAGVICIIASIFITKHF